MARKSIESDEMLQLFCDLFLICIAERKKKAREVRHREDSIFKGRHDTYVLKYSKKKEYGLHTDIELLADTGETIYMDSVDFMYNHKRNMFFWLNNTNCFAVQGNELKIEFNGYRYSSVDRSSDNYDYWAKRGIMIDLKLKLEELFK